jgi:phytanoyl-CoA hydroxylase
MSLPNITREICNAWKSDLTIASVVLSSYIGQIAALLGDWDGSRVAQDDIWMKPPEKGKEISYHQDCTYIPWPEITCWIALDNVNAETGTLEYVKGSHLWKKYKPKLDNENFHAPSQDYKKSLYLAAESEGITKEELEKLIVKVQIPAGGCSFHDGNLWHGSDINKSKSWRRNIAIHYIPSNSNFNGIHAGYIYGRYKKYNSDIMDESFFPIVIEKKLFVDYKLGLDKNWI